tara:strand:- start:622 stop:960 length:339 start_codon:yes stop_codon:yes gene_type:complete
MAAQPSKKKRKLSPSAQQQSIQQIMYGFGDDPVQRPDSVALMSKLLDEYVILLTKKAIQSSAATDKITVDDVLFALRKDRKKFARASELLRMNEELKKAKSMDMDETLGEAH